MSDYQENTDAAKQSSNLNASRQVKRGAIPSPTAVREGATKFTPETPEQDGTDLRRE